MANLIKIKRSKVTASPAQLSNGELAWTETGNVVFIGNYDGNANIPIAGLRVPGTLTANQALVVNATSMIDTVKYGNSIANVVVTGTGIALANSTNTITIVPPSTTAVGGNYFLKADGSWSTVTAGSAAPAGSNTNVQYNNSGTTAGGAGFTFAQDTNNVFIANTLTVTNATINGSLTVNTDTVIVGNSTVNAVVNSTSLQISNSTSNTLLALATAAQSTATNYFLCANGSWSTILSGAGGGDTQVQFNDGGSSLNATAGFTFTKGTNNVTMGNTLTVTSGVLAPSNTALLGNSIGRWVLTANSIATQGFSGNAIALNPTANTILLGNSIGQWVVIANSVTTAGEVANATGSCPTSNTIVLGNTIGMYVITANSVSTTGTLSNTTGIYPTSNTIVLGNTIGRFVVTANTVATLGFAGNSTALNPTANTILLGNTIGQWVLIANTASAVSINTAGFAGNATALNPTSNTILLGNSIGMYVVTANSVTTTGTVSNTLGFYPTSNTIVLGNSIGRFVVTANTIATLGFAGNTTALNPTANTILLGNSIGLWVVSANSVTAGATVVNGSQITVAGGPIINATTISTTDLTCTGNLVVSGTLVTIDATNLNVRDSMIFLADQNANQASFTDTVDIGFSGQYGNTTNTLYTGFFRDASSTGKLYKLIDATGNTPAPTTTFDTTNTSFSYGILQSWLKCTGTVAADGTGLLTVNTAGLQITANSTWPAAFVANTLSLSTPLPGTSGGLGTGTFTAGDLLFGNSTPNIDKLARGSDGFVLQSNSTNILWGALDGGTF